MRAPGTPFVGRERQVDALVDLARAAVEGRGGIALVTGEAGIGKSALVRQASAAATDRLGDGLVTGTGWCPDREGAPALWVWSQATAELDDEDLARSMQAGPVPSAAADVGSLAALRFQRLHAAARALVRATVDRPALLVLEDLHWGDADSLSLLEHVATAASPARLLVVGTSRDEALATRLARYPGVAVLPLPPLTTADVAVLLHSTGTRSLEPRVVHDRTGGLPLLVEAVARRGTLEATPDVAGVATALLAQVPPAARPVLEAAALMEEPEPELLALVCEAPPDAVHAALDAGSAAGLLAPDAGDGRRVTFRHALLRDGLRGVVPMGRAQAVHRSAARLLTARAASDPRAATAAAAHWTRAGSDTEALTETARLSVLAGGTASSALVPEEAERQYTRAVEALRRLGASPAELAPVLLALAEAQYLAGSTPLALRTCEEASAAALRAGRADLVAAAALVVRWVTYPQAAEVIDRLAAVALEQPELPTATRARLLAQRATMDAEVGRAEDAITRAVEALDLAEQTGDPWALMDAARARELTLVAARDAPERLRLGDLVVHHGTRLGQPVALVLAHEWRLRAGYELGRFAVVEEALRALAMLAETAPLPLIRWHNLRATAAVAQLEGRFEAARAANEEAADLAGTLKDPVAVGLTYAHATRLAIVRGDPHELPDDILEALAAAPPQPLVITGRAQAHLQLGQRPEARAYYERLLPLVADPPVGDIRWLAVVLELVDLAETFGDSATADALLPQLEPLRDCPGIVGISTVYFTGSPRRDVGRALVLVGRLDEAVDSLRRGLAAVTALGARAYVAPTRLDLASALLKRGQAGDLPEAHRHATAAAAEARRLDMPGPLARADALLREIVALQQAGSGLSEREAEVAELVLAALSNRQIADRLVISERTVESHVSSILRKAGARSRTEYLARHGDPA